MAKTIPSSDNLDAAHGPLQAQQREIETLRQLAAALPDTYTIYHGVHWTRVNAQKHALVGEIDFVILSPTGKLILIEQKAGFLHETADGLVKQYDKKEKRIATQMARSTEALRARLLAFCKEEVLIETLLYCPDYRVQQPGSAGIDPARIVDAARRDQLAAIIQKLAPDAPENTPLTDKMHRFFRNELSVVADVSALTGQVDALYTRLSGGLAEWARAIECAPFRLRVIGTAGSGKTQLALQLLRDAEDRGQRALYVCYNRPLADHIARLIMAETGAETRVATYHQLSGQHYRREVGEPNFASGRAFAQMEAFMDGFQPASAQRFDAIIIDEGQDFQPQWRDNLLRLLTPEGRIWWLEDPMQRLYDRPEMPWDGWVTLRSQTNYRSPSDIVAYLNRMLAEGDAITTGSPLTGSEVEILTYDSPAELMDATKTAIARALGAGFKKSMMAVITYRGREHSLFAPLDQLGTHRLRAFTGQYDLLSNPVYSDGDLLIDSVYRFKGQSAPCIIYTEIDFEHLDDAVLRKLFVGMTRASMKLLLVISNRAAKVLLETI
jgi:hypothetical protein